MKDLNFLGFLCENNSESVSIGCKSYLSVRKEACEKKEIDVLFHLPWW